MPILRGQLPGDLDDILTPDVVEAMIAKEELLKAGGLRPSGEDITPDLFHRCALRKSCWSGSAVFVRTDYYTRASRQHTGIQRAYEKAVAQMQHANIGVDNPRLEEPVSEADFTYPRDKVVNIHRGRKLNRKA